MLSLVLVFLALASLALLSQAGDTLELRNSYNITGIRSPEDPLDWDPIENTTLLAINVIRDRLDIWNITSETKIESFYTDRLIRDVECSPDGRYLAIAGSRNETNRQTLAVYDITTWADTYTGDDTPSEWSTDGDWSSDGQRFALGSRNGLIYVYDTSTWKRIYILQGPDSDEVEEVEFSTDGTLLAAGIGKYVRVFNLTTLQLVWSNFSGSGTVRWTFQSEGQILSSRTGSISSMATTVGSSSSR